MKIKTTEDIITENPISRLIMMTEKQRNENKNKKWVSKEEHDIAIKEAKKCILREIIDKHRKNITLTCKPTYCFCWDVEGELLRLEKGE